MIAPISLDNLESIGNGLKRPECVLATASGHLCTSDWRGGVCITAPDGSSRLIKACELEFEIRPNGIALMPDASFLLAHLGDSSGGLYRLWQDGRCEPVLLEVDGEPLPPCNFPHLDAHGRIWLTVSTRQIPRAIAYRREVMDGFIVLIDSDGIRARVVADGLGYTNECCVHPDGEYLYVNETFARRLSRFRIKESGCLGKRETVTEFGYGSYPDGLTFDSEGGIWITSIVSNRLIHVAADGVQTILLEDVSAEHLEQVEKSYLSGAMGRPELDTVTSSKLRNISSLAFGGPDLKTAYLGCLLGKEILSFQSGIAGHVPVHWHFPTESPKQ